MAFRNYITETNLHEEILQNILFLIQRDCAPYLKQLRNSNDFLWRGVKRGFSKFEAISRIIPRKNRRPSDTPIHIHDLLDGLFKDYHGWKARSEGVFCFGGYMEASNYGEPHIVFPIGKFSFLWNPDISDLYLRLKDLGMSPEGKLGEWELQANYEAAYGEYTGNGCWLWEGKEYENQEELEDLALDYFSSDEEEIEYCTRLAENNCHYEDNRSEYEDCIEAEFDFCKKEEIEELKGKISLESEWIPEVSFEEYCNKREKEWEEEFYAILTEIIKSYKDTGLRKAIKTDREIMLNCKSYYIVDKKYNLELKQSLLKGKVVKYSNIKQWVPKTRKM